MRFAGAILSKASPFLVHSRPLNIRHSPNAIGERAKRLRANKVVLRSTNDIAHIFFRSSIRQIKIPSKVTELHHGAFGECGFLSCVEFNEGLKKMGDNCFHKCTSMKSIDIPESVRFMDAGVLNECDSLVSVNI